MTQNPVPALIRTAFHAAGHRAVGKPNDLIAAPVAALRKLRRLLAAQAGDNVAYQVVDGPVTGFILNRNLQEFSRTGQEPIAITLPHDLAMAGPAADILLDAVDNGLILHKFLPDKNVLVLMAPELTACLCESLGGAPDTGALLTLLRAGTEEQRLQAEADGPATHRVH